MLIRLVLAAFLLCMVISCFSIIWQDGSLQINGISFNLVPEVHYRTNSNLCETIVFSSEQTVYPDSCRLDFTSEFMDVSIKIVPGQGFLSQDWQVLINQTFKADITIRDVALKIDWLDDKGRVFLRGPKAINSSDPNLNQDLYPFTEKQMQVKQEESSVWIIASGFAGCKDVEWLNSDRIYYYDNSLHFARLYNQTNMNLRLIDIKPCHAGQTDDWSFLLFSEKPFLPDFNLWPYGKRAALAISNDADGETQPKLDALFFGTSDLNSPEYQTSGLAANGIVASNTVFGTNIGSLSGTWDAIESEGSSIGYHTFSNGSDLSYQIRQSLLNDMIDYHIRLWIDHSLPTNPEDFGMNGGDITSPYYILDIINESEIDYAWLGDTPYTNPFNLFAEPWRLPHLIYYFEALSKPVWFFGRTRMEAWEYLNDYYLFDFKHNMTSENLDRLIEENGLCVCYTHFGFNPSDNIVSFYEVKDNGEYVIRNDVNDVLVMLNDYQKNHSLWIDTVENIFDRMFVVDSIKITEVAVSECPGFVSVTIQNTSDRDISNFEYSYGSSNYCIPLLEAETTETIFLNAGLLPNPDDELLPFLVQFSNGSVFVRSRDLQTMPAVKIRIYNVKGQLLYSANSDTEKNYLSLPFATKASGIYFARIEAEGYKNQISKFTVLK
jgi:hypothetical protein